MPKLDKDRVRNYLNIFDLRALFVEELGWDRGGADIEVEAGGAAFALQAVAHKRGMVAYQCVAAADEAFPDHPTRMKIDRELTKTAREHIVVYASPDRGMHRWQWVKREPGKPHRARSHSFRRGQSGEALIQKLEYLVVTLEKEEGLTIGDVTDMARAAFDVEKVTKRFYERFRKEHGDFLAFIEGFQNAADREWYASLMLNRMMFIYFIQKQDFLDGDPDYLRNRLERVRREHGTGRFQTFYRLFLRRLFHEGLGLPAADRAPDLAKLLGRVPYLNGGLFETHDLERRNPEVDIPDEAFAAVFEFFDAYQWHLDDRPLRNDNEINPDVLGYIFEKYVNQKQMGAYYTKEDITGYIGRNTVIPFLFDRARKACPVAFGPAGGVWRLLSDAPDRYIYAAMRHGITYDIHGKQDLAEKRELPAKIAAGLDAISQRGGWNDAASPEYALPTETWREHVARRRRYEEVRAKLAGGEVASVDDLVTFNLDIEKFAQDAIAESEGPELVRAFWQALGKVSILDPTCGSGAFLFAALNILEPLYLACLEAMRGFLDDLERAPRRRRPEYLSDFRKALTNVDAHASERYFILKSIVVDNLYGVDIMEEAVEICKLRLFLKLTAQLERSEDIEPLPDIDFNIRAGNTLVGFASLDEVREAFRTAGNGQRRMLYPEEDEKLKDIEEEAKIAEDAFREFRRMQTEQGMDAGAFTGAKAELRKRLAGLRAELDRYLAGEYGVKTGNKKEYAQWLAGHQPFHWFVEFYGIVRGGGFDVVIGNPPYKELRAVTEYAIRNLSSVATKNLYPLVMERSLKFSRHMGRLGFIVPVSSVSTSGYKVLQDIVFQYSGHFSSYDDRPSRLFDGLQHIQLSIHLIQNQHIKEPIHNVTECYRWKATEREYLFDCLAYEQIEQDYFVDSLPKISRSLEHSIIRKVWRDNQTLKEQKARGDHKTYYSRKVHNFLQCLDFVPEVYGGNNKLRPPTELKELCFPSAARAALALCLLNSSLFRWFVNVFSDCRHVNKRETNGFRIDSSRVLNDSEHTWIELATDLSKRLRETSEFRTMKFKHDVLRVQCIIPKLSKPIIDKIDQALAQHYGFTDEELDFIINYDIKYRMGL